MSAIAVVVGVRAFIFMPLLPVELNRSLMADSDSMATCRNVLRKINPSNYGEPKNLEKFC